MVGVPGRSKGCATCKRRRKKCSLERPVCSRCNKAGLACMGYDVNPVFINSTTTVTGLMVVARDGGGSEVTLRHSFNLTAYEEQYLGLFWEIYLPGGPPLGDTVFAHFAAGSWVVVARDISSQDNAVRKALLAVCTILIGQNDEKQWMVHESLKLYTSAMDDVRKSLNSPSMWCSDATLVAARALSAYELLSGLHNEPGPCSSRPKSWISHHLGQSAIITRRRPEQYVQGLAHRLFVDGRLQLAIAACLSNKRTFLSDSAWTTAPWSHLPKSPRDHLIDIVVQLPTLLEDVDILVLSANSGGGSSIVHRICDTYKRINADLLNWQETRFPQTEFSALQARKHQDREPTQIDISTAHLLTLFWTACLVTYNTMRVASFLSPRDVDPDSKIYMATVAGTRQSLDSYCQQIAGVVGILFHPAAGVFGAQFALFPIACSLVYLTTTQQLESKTADSLLEMFSEQMNRKALRKFVLGVVKEWPGLRAVSGSGFPAKG